MGQRGVKKAGEVLSLRHPIVESNFTLKLFGDEKTSVRPVVFAYFALAS